MINALSGASNFANVTAFVSSNGRILQKSLVHLAAGLKVIDPSNGAADYFTGNSYYLQAKSYDEARRGLFQASAILGLAEESISAIFDDLNNIMDYAKEYFKESADDLTKKVYGDKINEFKNLVAITMENTVFNGKKVLKDSSADPLFEVNIDPSDFNNKFILSFGADLEVNINAIDLSQAKEDVFSAIQEQIDIAAKFMGNLSGLKQGIHSQININEISSDTMQISAKNILGLDEIDGIIGTTKRQIQQQSAVSMLAQGNAMRASVLRLVDF
ncbi:MAG: hypothetical protein FWF51_06450 [Chitinivibrionia bacterium]|nr:hypothetical protein [Chitinivibrionia bacterium]MCL1946777.1 hypothetical protein [Chitinivibrionia bacterium]